MFVIYRLPNSDGFYMALTKVADPAYAISIIFPVTASVNTGLAADVLVASVASEWVNTLLKWFVFISDYVLDVAYLFIVPLNP